MNTLNLTDAEFRHYQELYNLDPVVQRLCKIDFEEIGELTARIAELEDEVEGLEQDNDSLREDIHDYRRENQLLREKIQVWKTLEE